MGPRPAAPRLRHDGASTARVSLLAVVSALACLIALDDLTPSSSVRSSSTRCATVCGTGVDAAAEALFEVPPVRDEATVVKYNALRSVVSRHLGGIRDSGAPISTLSAAGAVAASVDADGSSSGAAHAALAERNAQDWASSARAVCGYLAQVSLLSSDVSVATRHAVHLMVAHNDLGYRLGEMGLWPEALAEMQSAVVWLSALDAVTYSRAPVQDLLRNIVAITLRGRRSAQWLSPDTGPRADTGSMSGNHSVAFRAALHRSQGGVNTKGQAMPGYPPFDDEDAADEPTVGGLVPSYADGAVLDAIEALREDPTLRDVGTHWPPPRAPSAGVAAASASAKPRIGIATLCAYDPSETQLTALSLDNKLRYARRRGYELFAETRSLDDSRPPAWSKVRIMQKYLPRVDWLLWLDCDTFVMNPDRHVEDLLPRDAATTSGAGVGDDGGVDAAGASVHMVVSRDALMVNSGVFALRNHSWSQRFLDTLYGPEGWPLVQHRLWEQASLQYLLTRERHSRLAKGCKAPHPDASWLDGWHVWDGRDLPEWRVEATSSGHAADGSTDAPLPLAAHIRFVPQQWINAYPYDIAYGIRGEGDTPVHAVYTAGDWVVSFSGCTASLSQERCNELFEEHWVEADAALAREDASA